MPTGGIQRIYRWMLILFCLHVRRLIEDGVLETVSFGDPKMLEKVKETLPKDITLGQTVAMWKHIVQYQERLKKDGNFIERDTK